MLAFLHIPKTGGTTLRSTIRQAGLQVDDLNSPAEAQVFAAARATGNEIPPVLFGHMAWGVHTVLPGVKVDYVPFLREPISRLVSAYLHVARTPAHPRHAEIRAGLSFERYALEGLPTDNTMTRRLLPFDWLDGKWWLGIEDGELTEKHLGGARSVLRGCAMVGLFERFEADARALGQRLRGRWPDHLPRLNGSEGESVPVSRELRLALERRQRWDFELYHFARQLTATASAG